MIFLFPELEESQATIVTVFLDFSQIFDINEGEMVITIISVFMIYPILTLSFYRHSLLHRIYFL